MKERWKCSVSLSGIEVPLWSAACRKKRCDGCRKKWCDGGEAQDPCAGYESLALCDVQQWALWLCLLLAPAITFRSQGGEETPEEVRCTAGCMPLAAALSSWYRAWLSLFRSFYVTEISSTSSLLLDLFGLKRRKVLACCRQCHVKWQRLDKSKCLQLNRHAGSWSHWCHWTWLWISFLYPFPLSFFLFVKEMQCWSIAKETPCSKCRCFLCWASVPKANPWLGLLRMLSCLA